MERKKTFGAESKRTWDVLDRSIGFYIPPYQRQYDWDKRHITRLFEDISHGLMELLREKNKDSITFIGTLIVIDDTRPETIAPNISNSNLPGNGNILSVVDGQQRLTTILLMNICLHDEIKRRRAKLEKKKEGKPAFEWLHDRIVNICPNLQETFEEDKRRGDGVYQWQPRMIRAYIDSWSCFQQEAIYESPVAAFIHGYSRHIHNDDESAMNQPYTGESYIDKSDVLWKNYVEIQNLIKMVSGRGKKVLKTLPLEQVATDFDFQKVILEEEFPEDVCNILSNEGDDDFKELIRLVFFANFLMYRVWVTVVSAPGAYAYSMFESLNTTGEPLTVLETFRPKVIEFEGPDKYKNSDSRKYMGSVEEYLNQFTTAKTRQKGTYNLLRPFALAESGKKLLSDPVDQRQYMRNQYASLIDEEKRNFVRNLSHVADFMAKVWKKEGSAFSNIIEFTEEPRRSVVLMCIGVLGKANPITIGPLARFYSQVLLAQPDSRSKAVDELEGAVKAMTAFFALWRGIGRTTGTLADQYRDLMDKGFKKEGIQPFSRCPRVESPLEFLTAEDLRKALRYVLGKGRVAPIKSKKDWVRFSTGRAIYQDSNPLTRFLLFAAIHDTVEDSKDSRFPAKGLSGVLNMLSWEKWSSDLTIEHVAPQEPDPEENDWPEPLYKKPELLDCLGNLTLLPKAENSSVGRRAWRTKRVMYRFLASRTQEELDTRLIEARNHKIPLSSETEARLRNTRHFQHLTTIGNAEKWDEEFVIDRSERLAELVWENIAPWLGFDDE